jgi:MoxR-like ATPase
MHYTDPERYLEAETGADGARERRSDDPRAYRPGKSLQDAVNVALLLQRPLLVTGEPGTGKTQLAASIAWQLSRQEDSHVTSAQVEKFETKSTSIARDLFYSFDMVGRFHAAQANQDTDPLAFITFNALGRALLDALPPGEAAVFAKAHKYNGPRRGVVLIDEIDKAPRDFPNDLLNELDQFYFRIPELGGVEVGGPGKVKADYWPIVLITSNSEKALPEPFLRRCIYYDIPFPDEAQLRNILSARMPSLVPKHERLLSDALKFFSELRKDKGLERLPSTAELMQWLTVVLQDSKARAEGARLRDVQERALQGLPALGKTAEGQKRIGEKLKAFCAKA